MQITVIMLADMLVHCIFVRKFNGVYRLLLFAELLQREEQKKNQNAQANDINKFVAYMNNLVSILLAC